jgi:hypothetical protein
MLKRRARGLTAGETRMAALLFGAAIDPARVRVYSRRYLPLVQPRNCAMTPNGSIYFHPSCYLPDYTAGDPPTIHWFMHEMCHVWQHQLGYPVRLRGALRIGLPYHYALRADATLADYNMEAQGDLLADYFALKFMRNPRVMRQRHYASKLDLYEQVLNGFREHPDNPDNLPRGVARALGRML